MTPSPYIPSENAREPRSIATAQQQQPGWNAWPTTQELADRPAGRQQRLLPPEFEGLLYSPAFEGDEGSAS
jgi:hypothetical protein